MSLRIALVGTRGVPATYGGFETCVEEVGARLADRGHDVVVYCRGADDELGTYRGMRLVHLPAVRSRSLETLTHTQLATLHLVARESVDVVVLFNAANSPFIPLLRLRRLPVATHVDGLEWKRAKWGRAGRWYYRFAESLAVRWSTTLVADADAIARYYDDEFGAPSQTIAYGAPLLELLPTAPVEELGLEAGRYHLVVARWEPENHVDLAVEGYVRSEAEFPLVVVGSAPYAEAYSQRIHALADDRVRFLGGVWDQDVLDALYQHALVYVHGHSVGGTNPSLLRAMGAGTAVDAYDVMFNREVLGEAGRFWSGADELARLLTDAERDQASTRVRGTAARTRAERYDWDEVADRYEDMCVRLVDGAIKRPGLSGRRRQPGWREPVAAEV